MCLWGVLIINKKITVRIYFIIIQLKRCKIEFLTFYTAEAHNSYKRKSYSGLNIRNYNIVLCKGDKSKCQQSHVGTIL